MASSRIDGDLTVLGNLTATNFTVPSASVTNSSIASNAAIEVEKHESLIIVPYNNGYATSWAAGHQVIFVAPAACNIRAFRCGLVGKNTTGTSGFDLNVNGTTALSAHVTFTSADSNGDVKTGSLSTTTLAADDIVSIQLTTDAGSPDGTGAFAQVELDMVAP